MSVFVVDSGIGNVRSISSMLGRLGKPAQVISRPTALAKGDQVILPGVGSFDAGIEALVNRGFDDFVREAAATGCDVLGICLGMQLLCECSEEGRRPGLGLIAAEVTRLPAEGLRIPHMGWNIVRPTRSNRLLPLGEKEQRFYFVHSFQVRCRDAVDTIGVTDYGGEFTSAFEHGRLMGVQFHPEKSHRFGMALLGRFAEAARQPARAN